MRVKIAIFILLCIACCLTTQAQNKKDSSQKGAIHLLLNYGNNAINYSYNYANTGVAGKTGVNEANSSLRYYNSPVENYNHIQAAIRMIMPLENNWQLIAKASLGVLAYEFIQYNGTYNYQRVWEQNKITILNDGQMASVYGGIGKMYFLDKRKKIALLPNILLGVDGNLNSSKQKEDTYWGRSYEGPILLMNQLRIGAEFNLAFQYQLAKNWGLTLSFERLAYTYFKREQQKLYTEITEDSKHIEYFSFPNNVFFGIVLYP